MMCDHVARNVIPFLSSSHLMLNQILLAVDRNFDDRLVTFYQKTLQ